jgi:hypothetical protein
MDILIPKPKNSTGKLIKPGSGIVATDRPDGYTDIYFEGNLYGAENLGSYWGRLLCAAGRLSQKYPTVARLVDKNWSENFDRIGAFDYDGVSKELQSNPNQPVDDVIKRFCRIEPDKYPVLIDWLEGQKEDRTLGN